MPDPADERAAYREALARAEAAALAEAEGETPAPDEAVPDLAEAVPVTASDQQLTPEVETPEAPAAGETVETPVETPTATEDAEKLREQIAQLEARIAEKDNFIGRQSGEVGELRQAVEALSQRLETVASPAPQAPQPAQVAITQDLIDNDPAQATVIAFRQGDEVGLQRAFAAWKDPITGDPAAAAAWVAERRIEAAAQQQQAELAAIRQEMEALKVPQAQQAAQQEWQRAFSLVREQHEDFLPNAERILTEVAPKYPAFAETLANGDAQQKADVLRALYTIDKAERTDPTAVQQQLEEAAKAAADEETATLAAASVVAGQPTAGQSNAPELTWEQQEQERYKQRLEGQASLARGWTGRTS